MATWQVLLLISHGGGDEKTQQWNIVLGIFVTAYYQNVLQPLQWVTVNEHGAIVIDIKQFLSFFSVYAFAS